MKGVFTKKYWTRKKKTKPKLQLGVIDGTDDKKNVFSKGNRTICSHMLYTITEIFDDTIPTYHTIFLPEK